MLNWSDCPEVESSRDVLGGALVFAGSRVPISALFENLEDGIGIQEFIDLFPGVSIKQVRAVLDFAAKNSLTAA